MTILGKNVLGWESCRFKGSEVTTNSPDLVVTIVQS